MKYRADGIKDGTSSIELISNVYGRQAVVISVQPHLICKQLQFINVVSIKKYCAFILIFLTNIVM